MIVKYEGERLVFHKSLLLTVSSEFLRIFISVKFSE